MVKINLVVDSRGYKIELKYHGNIEDGANARSSFKSMKELITENTCLVTSTWLTHVVGFHVKLMLL